MEFRQLGGSGLKVPALCLGTGTFGGKNEFFSAWGVTEVEEATKLVDISLEAGLSMFDSADVYSDGSAEEILGKAIKGRRDQVIISTKATFRSGPGHNDVGSSRHHLINACEASLRRLGTDYIDLYQMHGFDALSPVEETLSALDDMVQWQGALYRLLEFLRVALDEVARGIGKIRPFPVRSASGVLFTGRA
jgi:aryl-alcohol dehydrogenase-like predicted oxidoreductase